MAAIVKSPTSASYQGINSNITKRLALRFSSIKRPCNLMMEQQRGMCFKRNVLRKSWDNNRISAIASQGDPMSGKNSFSPADTVDQFYTCINEKKLRELGECISRDACFDDFAFTKPFQGKKVCI